MIQLFFKYEDNKNISLGALILFKKIRLIFLRVLKAFDEHLDELNTERRVKISAGISNEGT